MLYQIFAAQLGRCCIAEIIVTFRFHVRAQLVDLFAAVFMHDFAIINAASNVLQDVFVEVRVFVLAVSIFANFENTQTRCNLAVVRGVGTDKIGGSFD